MLVETYLIDCPYCGERFETFIDGSAGSQTYYEDCYVCCRPIIFDIVLDNGELLSVSVRREDD